MTGGVVHRMRVRTSPIEEMRRDAVMAAAAELLRKLDAHEVRGYSHIAVGALHGLRDAYRGAGGAA